MCPVHMETLGAYEDPGSDADHHEKGNDDFDSLGSHFASNRPIDNPVCIILIEAKSDKTIIPPLSQVQQNRIP